MSNIKEVRNHIDGAGSKMNALMYKLMIYCKEQPAYYEQVAVWFVGAFRLLFIQADCGLNVEERNTELDLIVDDNIFTQREADMIRAERFDLVNAHHIVMRWVCQSFRCIRTWEGMGTASKQQPPNDMYNGLCSGIVEIVKEMEMCVFVRDNVYPYAYTVTIHSLTHAYVIISAMMTGYDMTVVKGIWRVTRYFKFLVTIAFFLALLEISERGLDPFGEDVMDIPKEAYVHDLASVLHLISKPNNKKISRERRGLRSVWRFDA